MTTPWWTGLARVDQEIDCGVHRHHLVWDAGRLTAADHPDADRERALVALGADPYPCLQMLSTWTAHCEDLDVLVLASRGGTDRLVSREQPDLTRGGGRQGHGAYASTLHRQSSGAWWAFTGDDEPGASPDGDGLTALLTLPGSLSDRLVAAVLAAWTERIEAGDPRATEAAPQLRAAVYGRLLPLVRNWTDEQLDITLIAADEAPSVTRRDARVCIGVPFAWLRDVWARGLATIFGQLCLSAQLRDDGGWRLETLLPDLRSTQRLTVSFD